jgi:hypothetical protein
MKRPKNLISRRNTASTPELSAPLSNPHIERDVDDRSDPIASIRRGLDQARRAEGRLAEDVFADLEREL